MARPGTVVIDELAAGLELDFGVRFGGDVSELVFAAVPFFAGLTLEEIGGRGVPWQAREAAAVFGGEKWQPVAL